MSSIHYRQETGKDATRISRRLSITFQQKGVLPNGLEFLGVEGGIAVFVELGVGKMGKKSIGSQAAIFSSRRVLTPEQRSRERQRQGSLLGNGEGGVVATYRTTAILDQLRPEGRVQKRLALFSERKKGCGTPGRKGLKKARLQPNSVALRISLGGKGMTCRQGKGEDPWKNDT